MGNRLNMFRDGIREVFYKVLFFYKEYIYKHEEKTLKKNNQKSFLKPLAFIKKMRYTNNSANVCVRKNVISNYKHMRCLL